MKEKEEKSNMADTKRTALVGKVVSAKNDKTITVLVETYRNDPLYHKRVKYSKKYAAHDEKNIAKVGDTVRLLSTRPLSKTKRYELAEVLVESVEL
jgi:small subunit ribosomal protein S17